VTIHPLRSSAKSRLCNQLLASKVLSPREPTPCSQVYVQRRTFDFNRGDERGPWRAWNRFIGRTALWPDAQRRQ
jgi:hypothetical protein